MWFPELVFYHLIASVLYYFIASKCVCLNYLIYALARTHAVYYFNARIQFTVSHTVYCFNRTHYIYFYIYIYIYYSIYIVTFIISDFSSIQFSYHIVFSVVLRRQRKFVQSERPQQHRSCQICKSLSYL